MPTVKVPLFSKIYRNVDGVELTDKSYELIDGYIDEEGYNVRRPGLELGIDLGLNVPITGLFWWPHKSVALAVCNDSVYKLTYSGGSLSATNITTNGPGSTYPATFTVGVDSNVTAPVLYGLMAAGGRIIEGNGTASSISNFTYIADADAPTTVSHVDFIDGYVLATTGKGMFQYADVNAPTTWSALSYATAMRNPDINKALKVYNRQIFLVGQVTTEIWENDGVTPFAPTPGGFLEYGTLSPYSVVGTSNGIYWLDHNRHIVAFRNGQVIPISNPYDKEISNFTTVSDCQAYRMEVRGKSFLVFQFPSEERTLVYDTVEDSWSEWGFWDSSSNEYKAYLGRCYAFSPEWGLHLVGSRNDSKVYLMKSDVHLDEEDCIRFKKVSGHMDYGTTARKRCKELRIKAKRGEGITIPAVAPSTDPTISNARLLLRWNDDNKGWSNHQEFSLGSIGETEIVIRTFPKGVYRTRQYEVTVTDAVNVIFGDAEEDLDILGR